MSAAASLNPALLAHYEELVGYVHKRFPSHDFARDVIHEVCEQLLRHPPQEEISTPLAYLRTLSLHRALDWCRAKALRQNRLEYVECTPDTQTHHEDGASLLDCQQQLLRLVVVTNNSPWMPAVPSIRQVRCVAVW